MHLAFLMVAFDNNGQKKMLLFNIRIKSPVITKRLPHYYALQALLYVISFTALVIILPYFDDLIL